MRHVNARRPSVEEKTSCARKEDLDPTGNFSARKEPPSAMLRGASRGLYERIIRIYTYLRNHYPMVPTASYRILYTERGADI